MFVRLAILLLGLGLAACAADPVDPPVPAGTVFPGEIGYAGDASGDTGGACTGDTCGGTAIAPGFRATLAKSTGDVNLEVGSGNGGAVSNGTILVYQQNSFSGGEAYNFTFQFFAQPGRYKVVELQSWLTSFSTSEAGFQYSEGTTGATSTASAAEGTLDVTQVSPRLIGRLSNGKVTLNGTQFSLSAEFNVPVQEQ